MKTYSLFVKTAPRTYKRLSPDAYRLSLARQVFQNALLAGSFVGMSMYLRPAEQVYPSSEQYDTLNAAREAFFNGCIKALA